MYNFWNLVCVIGVGIGWIKGFPRWFFTYLGMAVVFGWWWSGMSINNIQWGNKAWVPLFIMILIALLWTRSLKPLQRLIRSIRNDWTLLSVTLYSMIAWVMIVAAYDENHHPQLILYIMGSTVVLILGELIYLRSFKKWQKMGGLLSGLLLSVAIEAIVNHTYWSEHLEPWMVETYSWGNDMGRQLVITFFYATVLCAPGLLSLWPRSSKSI